MSQKLGDNFGENVKFRKRNLRPWLIWSLVVAGLGFASLIVAIAIKDQGILYDVVLTLCVICPVVWFVVLLAAIWSIRRRALWLLMGAPVALFGPVCAVVGSKPAPDPDPDPVISCQPLPPQETQQIQALLSQSAGRPMQVTMAPCAPGS